MTLTSQNRVLLSLFLAATVIGCGTGPARAPVPDRVVIVTIDTLRADHLPTYGYPVDTAPFLTSLAARSVDFRDTLSHSSTTGPSHASLFTSLYPIQHGVQNNGQVLDESFVTVAEVYRERGFETAAFVSGNAHFGDSHIAQGFEHFDQPPDEFVTDDGEAVPYRPADATTERVLAWLDERAPDDPFLLWVHYYDPHGPLRPPAEHLDATAPSGQAGRQALVDHLILEHSSPKMMPSTVDEIIDYDAEIRFVDAELQRLYERMDSLGGAEHPLWVITSDHGQGLSNHGWFGHHVNIYNEQLRVPLLFHFRGAAAPEPRVIEGSIVEHVDVPSTLLELIGEDFTDQAGVVQGRSLLPWLRGETPPTVERLSFAERRRIFREPRRPSHEPGERYSLQSLERKYIWFTEGDDEFYDLTVDPYETENLLGAGDPAETQLRDMLRELVEALRTDADAAIVDEETLERLRALGYIQ